MPERAATNVLPEDAATSEHEAAAARSVERKAHAVLGLGEPLAHGLGLGGLLH